MMKYKCDLHIHSSFSDGKYSPAQLIDQAKDKDLYAVALTDHDTIQGLEEGERAARARGIKFVSGIELSSYTNFEVHILGYNIPFRDSAFVKEISKIKQLRTIRNEEIVKRLRSQGIKLDVGNLFEDGTKGRHHIATMLFEQGYVRSYTEAFDKYLGTNKPCFVKANRISVKDAIKLIQDYQGVPVIAHPMRLLSKTNLNNFVADLVKWGIKGIEVYYNNLPRENELFLKQLADKYALIKTGGSDFHSDSYGLGLGCVDAYLEEYTLRVLKLL